MNTTVSPHMVALLFCTAIAPLSAQNMIGTSRLSEVVHKTSTLNQSADIRFTPSATVPGEYEVPAVDKAKGDLAENKPVYASQDSQTLERRTLNLQKVESVVDLSVLSRPSLYRKVAVSAGGRHDEIANNSLQNGLAQISAAYRKAGKMESAQDCLTVSLSVEEKIKLDISQVLEIVEAEVGANPTSALRIVKTAIKASDADVSLVVLILETAITAAPDTMRIVSQCAIATMPASIAAVQALLAKLDPNTGDEVYSSKSSKNADVAGMEVADMEVASINLLDPPALELPWAIKLPPIVPPSPVTDVNPRSSF